MKHLYSIILITIMAFTSVLYAEDSAVPMPNESLAIGAKVEAGKYGFGPFINYALNKDVHLGAQFGFFYDGGHDKGTGRDAEAFWQFSVHARAFLLNIKNMNVFSALNFSLLNQPRVSWTGEGKSVGESSTALSIDIGGMWYPFENLGIFTGFKFLEFNLDKSQFRAGLGYPFIGMEYYID